VKLNSAVLLNQKATDEMNGATAALLTTLLCLAGAAGAVSARRAKAPWWLVAVLFSVALCAAVAVLVVYLQA
jgi:hypothetical protein